MEALVPLVLSLIEQALPAIAGSSALGTTAPMIAKIINTLVVLAPVISQEYKDLKPRVAAVITALKADPATNAAQIEVLEAQEVLLDAEFDDAAAAALAEDAAERAKGK
jgi:hypothetical protein